MAHRRMTIAAVTLLMVVTYFTDGGRGEECQDKAWGCETIASREARVILSLFDHKPFNITAAMAQCRSTEEAMDSCEKEVQALCPLTNRINGTFASMRNTFRSVCEPDTVCGYKINECRPNRTVIWAVRDTVHQRPLNLPLIQEKCSDLNETVAPCVATLKTECSHANSAKNFISTTTSTLDDLCGKDVLCNFQSLQCSNGISGIHDIGEAMRQRPPNVKLVLEKCSAMNATVAPCVAKLKEDCGDVSSVKSTLSSITSGFNGLCGQEQLCQLKMRYCHTLISTRVHTESEDRQAHICRAIQQFLDCLNTDVGASCLSLPGIKKQVSDARRSALSGMKCSSGGKRVMESFVLILLMAAVSAWATTPSL